MPPEIFIQTSVYTLKIGERTKSTEQNASNAHFDANFNKTR